MIPSPDAVRAVIDAVIAHDLPFFLTGSLVSNAYGTPRFTADADFVIIANEEQIEAVFASLATDFERDAQLAFETVTGKTQHKIRHKGSGLLIELFEMKDDPFDESRMARRQRVRYLDRDAFFPTAEDVIVGKLRWFSALAREKDMEDIVHVIRRQNDSLDWPYIEKWCREHGSTEHLATARAAAAELDM
ncbi:MAG: hypothetical protein ACR2GY_04225 [Phycisphaerales bacterium]